MSRSLEELDSAISRDGAQAALHRERGLQHKRMRNFDEALADMDHAVALEPTASAAWAERAEVQAMRRETAACLADIEHAAGLSPEDEGLRFKRLEYMILFGMDQAAAAALAELSGPGASASGRMAAAFYQGLLHLRARSCAQAEKEFGLADELFQAGGLPFALGAQASFYKTLARVISRLPQRVSAAPANRGKTDCRLYLCGLGIRAPFQTTVRVLEALNRCEVIYSTGYEDLEITRFLSLFCPDVRPIATASRDSSNRPVAQADMLASLSQGKTVAFVTWGHPLVYGGLGMSLLRDVEAMGGECVPLASLSTPDHMLTSAALRSGFELRGAQIWDYSAVLNEPRAFDVKLPLLLYFNFSVETLPREVFERLCGILVDAYPPGASCWLYERGFEEPTRSLPLSELATLWGRLDRNMAALIPPRGALA